MERSRTKGSFRRRSPCRLDHLENGSGHRKIIISAYFPPVWKAGRTINTIRTLSSSRWFIVPIAAHEIRGKAVLNLGLSITEPNCMESSLSLSLSPWNSRNRRSYVSRISTTSDFQSSYASNPRSLIESTPQTSIFEFVSLSPIDPGERSNEHSFLS